MLLEHRFGQKGVRSDGSLITPSAGVAILGERLDRVVSFRGFGGRLRRGGFQSGLPCDRLDDCGICRLF